MSNMTDTLDASAIPSAATAPAAFASTRTIPILRAALDDFERSASQVRTFDGWRQPLQAGKSYRHVYDEQVAAGGWEFYELRPGMWLLSVDMMAHRPLQRRHSFDDKLVLSAVLKGDVGINDPSGASGELTNGYCTLYGMKGAGFDTVYDPGEALRWVSIVIDRQALVDTLNLDPGTLPGCVYDFVFNDGLLPYRNVRLSSAASLATAQILECKYQGGARLALLTAKACELACLSLFSLRDADLDTLGDGALSEQDEIRVARAKRLMERALDRPPTIVALASAVGLTRQKLQLGFRQLYGGTAGQIRDQLRIQRAFELVRNTQMSMIDIGMETGYDHPASFTRAFKAAYGVAPIQMRRIGTPGGGRRIGTPDGGRRAVGNKNSGSGN